MSEAVVFQSSVESVVKMTRGRLSPKCSEQLRALGFDFEKPLSTAYALDLWEQATELIIADLFPVLPLPMARIEFGKLFMRGFADTAIGRAAVMLGKAIGIRRTLARMTRNMRNGNNYTDTEVLDVARGHVELSTRMRPEFLAGRQGKPSPLGEQFVGVLQAAMELLGAQQARVSLKAFDAQLRQTTYTVQWKE